MYILLNIFYYIIESNEQYNIKNINNSIAF